MKPKKLTDAALARLIAQFRRKLGPPTNDQVKAHWRRTRCGLTTAELEASHWDVMQLEKARWIKRTTAAPNFWGPHPTGPITRASTPDQADSRPLKIWTPSGPVYSHLFDEQPRPNGVFSEVRHGIFSFSVTPRWKTPSIRHPWSAPSGWRYNDPSKGLLFLKVIRQLIDTLKSGSPRKAEAAVARFNKKFGQAQRALWRSVPSDNPTGVPVAYVNVGIIPRSAAGKKFLFDLADILDELYSTPRGSAIGGPSETRALREDELAISKKLRKRRGTQGGSIRFIAEELRERGSKKKDATIQQNLKRHYRRHRP